MSHLASSMIHVEYAVMGPNGPRPYCLAIMTEERCRTSVGEAGDIIATAQRLIEAGVLTGDNELFGVQCMFSTKDEPELAQLSAGQSLTIQGICQGYWLDVILKDCSIK